MNDTIFLRFLAIILIVNSHCDAFYPIPALATGGAIGNSIFFLLSAYGLYLSFQKKNKSFSEWYAHRIARIYPAIWVFLITIYWPIALHTSTLEFKSLLSFLGNFFYPPFWFIQALMIFYFFLFLIINKFSYKKLSWFAVAIGIIYIYSYVRLLDLRSFVIEDLPFKIFFYFGVCLFGIFLASKNEKIKYAGIADWVGLVFCIGVMYAHKYLMTRNILVSFQLIQHLIIFPMMYFFIKVSRSPFISIKVFDSPLRSSIVKFISELTLEIYIIHMAIAGGILKLETPFPGNLIIFIISTVVLAKVINVLANKIFFKNPVFKS